MATTNYFKVKLLDEKLIPFLGLGERGPRENVILSSNDLASLKQAGWTVTDVQPLPETGKIKYDRRTVYFKSEGETGKFINVPFYINPVDARDVLGLLKFDLIKLSDKSVVKTYTAKDIKSGILSLPTSDLEINEEYELKLYFPKDASENYDIAISEGHKNLFERVKDSIFIKVKEYGKFTGRLVQLQQDINVLKESALPLEKILGYKDFDTKEVTPVAKENLLQLLSVNISDDSYAKYQSDKNRLLFFSKTGEIVVKVIERNIQDNIVNFNIRVVSPEQVEKDAEKSISYPLYDVESGSFKDSIEEPTVDPEPAPEETAPEEPVTEEPVSSEEPTTEGSTTE